MRELLRAVVTRKPLVALLEPEQRKGGLTEGQILEQLQEAGLSNEKSGVWASMYERWGLAAEVSHWGYELPSAVDLHESLFAREPIEWNRIGAFQVHCPRREAGGGGDEAEMPDLYWMVRRQDSKAERSADGARLVRVCALRVCMGRRTYQCA